MHLHASFGVSPWVVLQSDLGVAPRPVIEHIADQRQKKFRTRRESVRSEGDRGTDMLDDFSDFVRLELVEQGIS